MFLLNRQEKLTEMTTASREKKKKQFWKKADEETLIIKGNSVNYIPCSQFGKWKLWNNKEIAKVKGMHSKLIFGRIEVKYFI